MEHYYIFVVTVGLCDPVSVIPHATPDGVSCVKGNVIKYSCEYGYTSDVILATTCDGNDWSSITDTCSGMFCNPHFGGKLMYLSPELFGLLMRRAAQDTM